MAFMNDGRTLNAVAAVETKTKALRVTEAPRGVGFTLSSTSGLIAAAAAANGLYFAMRSSTGAGNIQIFIEKIRLQYTTIGAYTTAVTAGRRLSLYRGATAAATGGTALTPLAKDPALATSQVTAAAIATTASLGITSITWEAQPFREVALSHVGAAGGNVEDIYEFNCSSPIILQPGQLLGIRNPQAMDAAGTWQISIDVDWHESVNYSSTVLD